TFAASLGVPADRLEGYLYPDTYPFYPLLSPDEVARVMVGRSLRVFEEEMGLPGARQGLTLHQLVTLASIVEAEAAMPVERPRIAAVFYNRLKRGMMLQSDPTVTYALGIFRNRVYYSDLNVKSPYNTYRNRGLPPGPIDSPGRAALHAVLFPLPDSTELYFVARGDGTHIFSKSWEEHLAAIAHVRALAKSESTTAIFTGPLPPPPTLLAMPDSAPPSLRADRVSAPSKRPAPETVKKTVAGHGKSAPASPKKTAASKKRTARPSGPPAPSASPSTTPKHKKRVVKP
ncbi:MAG TPA: endolytic transglycosylase MltG, partial [Candidatus Binatia bacterium]|nr:endolytic transglycosylase MltG [Candidatus Binatia bacterium]